MMTLVDRILQTLFYVCLAFVLISLGIMAYYFNWGISRPYKSLFAAIHSTVHPKPDPNRNGKITNAKVESLLPDKAYAGYTFISKNDNMLVLLDMDGKVVHQWQLSFSKVWMPNHEEGDNFVAPPEFGYAQLFPNGDVIAIYHAKSGKKNPVYGVGMVKINADSKVIWNYGANVHDAMYIAEDKNIYTLVQEKNGGAPIEGLRYAKPPQMIDQITILSPQGKEEKHIPVLQAFLGTPYEDMLYAYNNAPRYTLTNAVVVLEKDMAAKFPLFQAGDMLVTIANMDAIAVIRPQTGKVIWASRGIWRRPYDAKFMEDGTIMLYDSQGYYDGSNYSKPRLLRVDPATQAIRWFFIDNDKSDDSGKPSGMEQLLPNGNVLMVQEERGMLMEITPDGQLAWQMESPTRINSAQRVSYDMLEQSFLDAEKK